jgi:hypothetical protein
MRPVCLSRKNSLFAGSDEGGENWACLASLVETCKLNGVTLKDTTLKQYHADLDRRLDRIMAAVPIGEPGRKLRKRIAANRGHLFACVTNRGVPYTNNVSERNLRPSVIFRKVTNGSAASGVPKPTPHFAPSSVPQRRTRFRWEPRTGRHPRSFRIST